MPDLTLLPLLVLGSLTLLFLRILFHNFSRRNLHQPPGPRGYPFLGYLKKVESPAWETYGRWGEVYGASCSLSCLANRNVMKPWVFERGRACHAVTRVFFQELAHKVCAHRTNASSCQY